MPTLLDRRSWKITMYFGDHNPPHFHIVTKTGQEAQIAIATLTVMAGEVDKRVLDAVIEWASKNKTLLLVKWLQYRLPPE
jgi:hypothetical protein